MANGTYYESQHNIPKYLEGKVLRETFTYDLTCFLIFLTIFILF